MYGLGNTLTVNFLPMMSASLPGVPSSNALDSYTGCIISEPPPSSPVLTDSDNSKADQSTTSSSESSV